jgi:hypothetical protein
MAFVTEPKLNSSPRYATISAIYQIYSFSWINQTFNVMTSQHSHKPPGQKICMVHKVDVSPLQIKVLDEVMWES